MQGGVERWLPRVVVMKRLVFAAVITLTVTACAEFKSAGRSVGHATRDVTREVGHTTRDAAKAVGHASKNAAKKVGSSIKGATSD